jgi:XTP/dITP diphosphohydrolase
VTTLYLASSNPGKLREFRQAGRARGFNVQPVTGMDLIPPCIEDGTTFEANARRKGLHYSSYVDGLVFADDSGICVEALGNAPGVCSARFAGPEATDEQNNQKLLEELHQLEAVHPARPPNRAAHYICVIALAERGRIITTVQGCAEGVIIDEPRGRGGFGYDPYFFYPPLGLTFAEITPEDKFTVSHRGEAFRKLLDFLNQN